MPNETQNEEMLLLSERLKKVAAISALYATEGGKILVQTLLSDIVGLIELLAVKHKDMTLQEFIALGASIQNKLDMVQAIAHSPANTEQARQELKQLMISTGEEVPELKS